MKTDNGSENVLLFFHMLINYQRHFWVKMSDKNKKHATIHDNTITTIHVVKKPKLYIEIMCLPVSSMSPMTIFEGDIVG